MKKEELFPVIFTLFQICWAYIWAAKHFKIRASRLYSKSRTLADTNRRYRLLNPFLYVSQNLICIASFWSNSDLLLKFHNSNSIRFFGALLFCFATLLYFRSLEYLGRNYSPCFDSHLPFELVSNGPYKFIRHPMYLAKMLVGIATVLLSGSLWWLPMLIYLALETVKTVRNEEKYLTHSIPEYSDYRKRTTKMIPYFL